MSLPPPLKGVFCEEQGQRETGHLFFLTPIPGDGRAQQRMRKVEKPTGRGT